MIHICYVYRDTGMSIATVTAARIYKGQKQGKSGEEEQLAFERFPYTALAKVRNCSFQSYSSNLAATIRC